MADKALEPTAALVIIGAEVLSGKVDDANGPFLIRALRARGVQVAELRVIGDTVGEIDAAVRPLKQHVDYVFTTGGIGPTHDDVTVAGVAQAFDRPVVRHPELRRLLHVRYEGQVNEARLKMAEVPEGAQVVLGDGTFVPIVTVDNVFILPGVPSLMRACFAQIAPSLRGAPFFSQALLLDVTESDIAHVLSAVQDAHPDVAIGSYPRFDAAPYRVKVTVDGRDAGRVKSTLAVIRQRLEASWIVGEQ